MRRLVPHEWNFEFCVERGCVAWYAVTRAISIAAVALSFFSASVTSNPPFRKGKKKGLSSTEAQNPGGGSRSSSDWPHDSGRAFLGVNHTGGIE